MERIKDVKSIRDQDHHVKEIQELYLRLRRQLANYTQPTNSSKIWDIQTFFDLYQQWKTWHLCWGWHRNWGKKKNLLPVFGLIVKYMAVISPLIYSYYETKNKIPYAGDGVGIAQRFVSSFLNFDLVSLQKKVCQKNLNDRKCKRNDIIACPSCQLFFFPYVVQRLSHFGSPGLMWLNAFLVWAQGSLKTH